MFSIARWPRPVTVLLPWHTRCVAGSICGVCPVKGYGDKSGVERLEARGFPFKTRMSRRLPPRAMHGFFTCIASASKEPKL